MKPCQINLFDGEYKKLWFESCFEVLNSFDRPFWYSDFRIKMETPPAHSSWWGSLTGKMKARGYRQTGNRRQCPIRSTNGRVEFEWELPFLRKLHDRERKW